MFVGEVNGRLSDLLPTEGYVQKFTPDAQAAEVNKLRDRLAAELSMGARFRGLKATALVVHRCSATGGKTRWSSTGSTWMARGFVYLAVALDWFSRRVLSWGVSITMEVAFCVETLEDALARHGKPDIFNTDQGSQFTGSALHRRARHQRHCDQHGRERGFARERFWSAAL